MRGALAGAPFSFWAGSPRRTRSAQRKAAGRNRLHRSCVLAVTAARRRAPETDPLPVLHHPMGLITRWASGSKTLPRRRPLLLGFFLSPECECCRPLRPPWSVHSKQHRQPSPSRPATGAALASLGTGRPLRGWRNMRALIVALLILVPSLASGQGTPGGIGPGVGGTVRGAVSGGLSGVPPRVAQPQPRVPVRRHCTTAQCSRIRHQRYE